MPIAFAAGVRAVVKKSVVSKLSPELQSVVGGGRIGAVRTFGASNRKPADRRYALHFQANETRPIERTQFVFKAQDLELAPDTRSMRVVLGPGTPPFATQLSRFRIAKGVLEMLDKDHAALNHMRTRGYLSPKTIELAEKRLFAEISRVIKAKR